MALMESSSASAAGKGRAIARWFALAALLGLVAVAFADSSIVVLALPDLLGQFDVSITSVAWVVTAYNLSLAVVAIVYVRIPSRSRQAGRVERVGALLFLAASAGCAVASSVWLLVGFRVVQGAGAGLVLVAALPLIRGLASTPQRGTALWAGAGVFGAALGPALGGVLTDVFSWRAIFVAQAPIAAVAFIAAVSVRGQSVDLVGLERPGGPRRHAASLALALASAALVGLMFLAVVQLIDVCDSPCSLRPRSSSRRTRRSSHASRSDARSDSRALCLATDDGAGVGLDRGPDQLAHRADIVPRQQTRPRRRLLPRQGQDIRVEPCN
jgi:MFS family permease